MSFLMVGLLSWIGNGNSSTARARTFANPRPSILKSEADVLRQGHAAGHCKRVVKDVAR